MIGYVKMLAIKSKKRFEYCSGLTVEISAPAYTENWEGKEGRTSVLLHALLLTALLTQWITRSVLELDTGNTNCNGPQA